MLSFNFSFLAKVVAGGGLLWVVSKSLRVVKRARRNLRLAKQWHCEPVARYKTTDPVLGIDLILKLLKAIKTFSMLQFTMDNFDNAKVNSISFPLMGTRIITTREPENIKAILAVNFDHYGIEPLRKGLVTFLGKGIFVVDGAAWTHSRSVLRPIFTRSQLNDLSILSTHGDRLLKRIPIDGSTIDLQPLFFDLTLDVASHVLFGQSTDSQISDRIPEFVHSYNGVLSYFESGGDLEIFGLAWPSRKRRQYKKDCKIVNNHIANIVEDAAARGNYDKVDPDRYILLESLLSQGLPHEQVRAEILNTLLAGRDTTASMLSDLWFELSRHPKVFAKLQAEISSHIDPDQEMSFETIKSLSYLKATLNEILRIHPVVPENSRFAMCNTMLPLGGGPDETSPVFVREGTLVSYSTYCMHRRQDIWGPDADDFKPERWLDHMDEQGNEVKGVRPGWAYLPFNGGPRVCIGQQFALLQASYVTIRIMQSIELLESRDPEPWVEKIGLTATGRNGCKVAMRAKA